ncbi:MAG: response regulator [Bacillati bacterium ANGP1]|uniref:histidine kinase n=1 Tax=Candidatus Segetimicrobium genomatis TaxID=2569760 RepID=A0A537M8T3_9BACT|nr:MAG: response regulator [Terrabacteria group bacterium ANGP1]
MDSLTPEQRQSVSQILRGGRHLLELINEVLDITGTEEGRLALSLEAVSVCEVARECFDLVKPLAAEGKVLLDDRAGRFPDAYVMADRQRLKRALLNLLSNAAKYNRQGGTITLTCEERPQERLRIQVSDTGLGIPLDKLERLFTPFDRLGAERGAVNGVGLGLLLSKRLVEAMGGSLGVESIVGKGSTFWIDLGRVEGPVQRLGRLGGDLQAPGDVVPSRESFVVLYIEDNLSNLTLIQRLLVHRPEVRVLPAADGRRGLELSRADRPDLILLDQHLPDIPGEEVLRRLKETPETRQIPVVMISADATVGRVGRVLAAGARAYLTKPLDVRKLLALLDEILTAQEPEPA